MKICDWLITRRRWQKKKGNWKKEIRMGENQKKEIHGKRTKYQKIVTQKRAEKKKNCASHARRLCFWTHGQKSKERKSTEQNYPLQSKQLLTKNKLRALFDFRRMIWCVVMRERMSKPASSLFFLVYIVISYSPITGTCAPSWSLSIILLSFWYIYIVAVR